MALINNIYVFVEEESVSNSLENTTHPVEDGVDLSDHVKVKPWSLNISGRIVGEDAAETLEKLLELYRKGALINYTGRNYMPNGQIVSFEREHPHTVWKGMTFSMEIREIRIAQSAYTETETNRDAGVQQIQKNTEVQPRYHTVKKGESRWSIAEQYKSHGCTIEYLTEHNNNTDCLLEVGNWYTLKVGAQMLVGEW